METVVETDTLSKVVINKTKQSLQMIELQTVQVTAFAQCTFSS